VNARNLAAGMLRRSWPKAQPRRPRQAVKKRTRPPEGFPEPVQALMLVRAGGVCEIDGCGPVDTYHHRRPRGLGGTSLGWVNQAANGLAISNRCHESIESNRAAALENGWLVKRNGLAVSAEVKVLRRGVWVYLADNGTVAPEGNS